jgi:molecular chaperone DnaK (HSP70)
LPDYGRQIQYRQGDRLAEQVSIIPSVIHYDADGRRWLGQQVIARNLYGSPRTFRWMKRYVARRSPTRIEIDGKTISHREAGRDFLSAVLTLAAAEAKVRDEEVAFTVPVEAFEHYENWLAGVAESVGLPRFRLLDEPSAAALGYGVHARPGEVNLLFDFGGGTLDVAVVLIEESGGAEAAGRRCRVLGKAGADLGGATFDQWLFQEFLAVLGQSDADDLVQSVSRSLLVECERAKEKLSFQDRADIRVDDGRTKLAAAVTRQRFEEILDENGAFTQMNRTIRRAINAAGERGYAEENIKSVLMLGGSSMIPAVQQMVQRLFGRERVMLHRPLDAVARGAAAFVAGVDFEDHIQHDYAIRFVDPRKGDYAYRPLVAKGTPYPSTEPLARLTIKASHDGQKELGLAIFELGERHQTGSDTPVELVFDPSGAARVSYLSPEEEERRYYFWINEHTPTFLSADPPARQSEPCFEVEFGIDANKRLTITARDLRTNEIAYKNHPVVRLT